MSDSSVAPWGGTALAVPRLAVTEMLGASHLRVFGGAIPKGATDAQGFEWVVETMKPACDYAAAKGVNLSIKPHGGQNATGPQCRQLIERVGHKNFRLWFDLFSHPVKNQQVHLVEEISLKISDLRKPRLRTVCATSSTWRWPRSTTRIYGNGQP